MGEPLSISDGSTAERLLARFDVRAQAIEDLALGLDADARVVRVRTRDGDLFLKIRRGPVREAGLMVPRLLAARGVPHLIAPIPTVTGAPFDAGAVAFILFPWVEGRSGGELGMSGPQWTELGATVRAIHDKPVAELGPILASEDFVPTRTGLIRRLRDRFEAEEAGDPIGRELAQCWRSHREEIDRLVTMAERLAPVARDRGRPAVICHADIHAWNVMVEPGGGIVIVDWDSAMFAPRERDLMFVDGVAGGHEADPEAFFAGYGQVEIDADVMDYYRVEWTVQDIAEFAAHVLLDDTAGDDDRAETAAIFVSMFAPGGRVAASLRHGSG